MAFLLRHFGQRPSKYKFDVVVHSATDLPVKKGTQLVCSLYKSNSPGTAVTTNPQTFQSNREVYWSEHLSFQSTIFTNPTTNEIYKKMFTIEVREKNPMVKRVKKKTAWTAQINIAKFAATRDTIEISLTEVPKNSVFSSYSRGSQAPSIKITFESSWISDIKDSEVSENSVMSRSPTGSNRAPPGQFVQKEGVKKKLVEEVLPNFEDREKLVNDLQVRKEEYPEEENEEFIVEGEFQQISRKIMDLRPRDLTSTMTSLVDDESSSSSSLHESQECEGDKDDFCSYEDYHPPLSAAAPLLPAVSSPSVLPVPNYGSTTTGESDVCTRTNGVKKQSFFSCCFCCA